MLSPSTGYNNFAENRRMFLKFETKFAQKGGGGGGKFQKSGNGTMFYFSLYVFPEIFMHF